MLRTGLPFAIIQYSSFLHRDLPMDNSREQLRLAIEAIISTIPRGKCFDSHFVIFCLLKSHSDVYFRFIAQFADTETTVLTAHGQLAQEIGKCSSLARRMDEDSFSFNIHVNFGPCALWQRL